MAMKTIKLALLAIILTGCATLTDLIEGEYDSKEEYQQAVEFELSKHNLNPEVKS
jgi:starvation-inducible outer membrane lipoprotein